MLYCALFASVLVVGLLFLFFWRLQRRQEYSPVPNRKSSEDMLEAENSPPQLLLFRKEILEKKKLCQIFELAKHRFHSPKELSPQQREVLYQELKKFPLPSGAAVRLSELLRDPYADSKEVAALAATDPVISARLLAIVNSAYFRPRGNKRVNSIHQAILLLGFNQVRNLVFHTFLENSLKEKLPLPPEEIKKIWIHSATVSVVAGHLAKQANLPSGLALTAGLLHDIGKFFLPFFDLGQEGSLSLQELKEDMPPFIQEEVRYGFNHCVIGSVLAHLWSLPPEIIKVIAFHHFGRLEEIKSFKRSVRQAIILVAVADNICHLLGEAGEEPYLYQIPQEALEVLELPTQLEELITPQLKREIERMALMLEKVYR